MKRFFAAFAAFAIGFVGSANAKNDMPRDPLNSVMWESMYEQFFDGQKVVFDDRVTVNVPSIVENQAQVPVTADATQLAGVQRLIVFADLNPIAHVLTLMPEDADPVISFRMKVEQGTPIRAAALTEDGIWHVGSVYLDAAGGGCSAPAAGREVANWADNVGKTQGRVWRQGDGSSKIRLRIQHPMDTGLAMDGTPAFFIEDMAMRSPDGKLLARLKLSEAVSEDPTLSVRVRLETSSDAVIMDSRDNSGSTFKASFPAPFNQS